MGEFFKPWRRKVGCGLLTVALSFFVAWMRGQVYGDVFRLPMNSSDLHVATGFWGIGVQYSVVTVPVQPFQWRTYPKLTPVELQEGHEYNARTFGPDRYSKWEFCGFGMTRILESRQITMSHWYAIAPLVVLSAFLLLWKPRPKSKAKPDA